MAPDNSPNIKITFKTTKEKSLTGYSCYISEETCCLPYPTIINLEPDALLIKEHKYTYPIKHYRDRLVLIVIDNKWQIVKVESLEEEVERLRSEIVKVN